MIFELIGISAALLMGVYLIVVGIAAIEDLVTYNEYFGLIGIPSIGIGGYCLHVAIPKLVTLVG